MPVLRFTLSRALHCLSSLRAYTVFESAFSNQKTTKNSNNATVVVTFFFDISSNLFVFFIKKKLFPFMFESRLEDLSILLMFEQIPKARSFWFAKGFFSCSSSKFIKMICMKWARNAIWEVRKCNRMEKLPSSGLSRAQNISVRLRRRFKTFLEGCMTQCKKKERKKRRK